MEAKPINLTLRVIFSRTIFECAGFWFGILFGVNIGFGLAFIYIAVGGQ